MQPLAAQERGQVQTAPASVGALTLEQALRRALDASPYAALDAARRDGAAAARVIAGLPPRPSVEVTAENFGLPMNGLYEQFQLTGTYSKPIERGGKREARIAVANSDLGVAEAELLVARLDLIKTVQMGFVEAQAAAAKVAIAEERLRVARELRREVGRRVASAKDPIFAGTRAQTGVDEAEADLELAKHNRDAAVRRLTALWGSREAPSLAGTGTFLNVTAVPAPPATDNGPDAVIAEARLARGQALVALERANAARDLTVSAGPRILGTGAIGAVAGVSMPLGGKRIADARIAQVQADARRIEAEMTLDRYRRAQAIMLAAEKVEESRHEVELLRGDTLENAEKTVSQVRFGYNRGFFSFADVNAAQTTLVNTRARIVDAARRYHEARAELDRLTGRFLNLAQESAK